ncbi:MAG: hypothetical protein R6U57_13015 [Anaerolineales bacterium]
MSYQQKNITVSLVSFVLILGFYLFRASNMIQNDIFTKENISRLWITVALLAVVATIIGIILTHIVSAIIQTVKTGTEETKIDDVQDERDQLINLKGFRITHVLFSFGVFLSMLAFTVGHPPLVMFGLLIFWWLFSQIVGDLSRLYLYHKGS